MKSRKKTLDEAKPQAPTAKGYFRDHALCPEIAVACNIMGQIEDKADEEWFISHAETWIRYLHANNKVWRQRLERQSNDDRDFVVEFIKHWLAAFLKDPETYKHRHTLEALDASGLLLLS